MFYVQRVDTDTNPARTSFAARMISYVSGLFSLQFIQFFIGKVDFYY